MKRKIKLGLKIIISCLVILTIVNLILAKLNHSPILCYTTGTYLDGGTKEYWCLGFKVINYNKLNGYHKTQIGWYNLKYNPILGNENAKEREAITHPVDIEITEENKYQIIEEYIQNNLNKNFKLSDYKILDYVETNGGLHFTYTPYGIETPNNYTAIIKDNKIYEFGEYTEENFEEKYEMLKNQKLLSKEKEEELKNKVLNQSREDYQITIRETKYYYENGRVIYYIIYDIDPGGPMDSDMMEYTLNTDGKIIKSKLVP